MLGIAAQVLCIYSQNITYDDSLKPQAHVMRTGEALEMQGKAPGQIPARGIGPAIA
jgi:hypothetical protein